jgi:hypothetical protein
MATFPLKGQNRPGARGNGAGPLDAGVTGAEARQEDHVGAASAGVSGSRADALSGRLGQAALLAALGESGEVFRAASAAGGETGIAAGASGNGGAGAARASGTAAGASAAVRRAGTLHKGKLRGGFLPNLPAPGSFGPSGGAAGGASSQQRAPEPQIAVGSASAPPSSQRPPVTGAGSLPEVDDRRRVLANRHQQWTPGRQVCESPFEIGQQISAILDVFPSVRLPFVVGTSVKAFSEHLLNQAAPMLPAPSRFCIPPLVPSCKPCTLEQVCCSQGRTEP